MTQFARIEPHCAELKREFGYNLACRWFGKAAIDALPTISRGPNKGKPRGFLHWQKCTVGGWLKEGPGYMNGHVCRPGLMRETIAICENFDASSALILGRSDLIERADSPLATAA